MTKVYWPLEWCCRVSLMTYLKIVLEPDKISPSFCRISFCALAHRRCDLCENSPTAQRFVRVPEPSRKVENYQQILFCVLPHCPGSKRTVLTILSRSSSIFAINLLNCLRLSTITCSSSVCVDPMHSKLNSPRLFDSVRCVRDRSVNEN